MNDQLDGACVSQGRSLSSTFEGHPGRLHTQPPNQAAQLMYVNLCSIDTGSNLQDIFHPQNFITDDECVAVVPNTGSLHLIYRNKIA